MFFYLTNGINKKAISLIIFSLVFVFGCFPAQAADLKIKLDKSTYQIGDTIYAQIILSSTDQSANALSGVLIFSNDKLTISSVDKSGSLINIWTQEPAFSNTNGQVSFEGAILNPGFKGSAGKIITLIFKAKKSGSATLTLGQGSVLASDGEGTAILNNLGQAKLSIVEKEKISTPILTSPSPLQESNIPEPIINSLTHPTNQWSNNSRPQFFWDLPAGITGVNLLLDDKPLSDPPVKSAGLINTYAVDKDLADGEWYFHLKFKKGSSFGPTAHYLIKIDTVAPTNLFVNEEDPDNKGFAKFKLAATDQLSGIANYEITVDSDSSQLIAETTTVWQTPKLKAGSHQLLIKAIDQAGNSAELSTNFEIIAPWWEAGTNLLPPRSSWLWLLLLILIILLPTLLLGFTRKRKLVVVSPKPAVNDIAPFNSAEALVVFSGRAYPGNDVSVLLADQVLAKTRTGLDGKFEISFNHLSPGSYNFSLQAWDSRTNQRATQVFPMVLTAGVTIRTTDIFLVPAYPQNY